jgi:hypothetical protein
MQEENYPSPIGDAMIISLSRFFQPMMNDQFAINLWSAAA